MEIRFPLILDGATGTELQKRGYTGESCAEQWVLEHPESILEVQRAYVAAGSKILYSPTFGANRQKLEDRKIFNRTAQMNRELASLSRQAADGRAWVAGDIAPTDASSRRSETPHLRSLWIYTPSRPRGLSRRGSTSS